MNYKNFKLFGEEQIEEWAHQWPFRMNRLITALEEFVCDGPATRVAPADGVSIGVEVYLTPPRSILRGVPDAAALVLVNHRAQTIELIEVIDDYVETDEQDWLDVVSRAERALEIHR